MTSIATEKPTKSLLSASVTSAFRPRPWRIVDPLPPLQTEEKLTKLCDGPALRSPRALHARIPSGSDSPSRAANLWRRSRDGGRAVVGRRPQRAWCAPHPRQG
jgi:hypothetical protein